MRSISHKFRRAVGFAAIVLFGFVAFPAWGQTPPQYTIAFVGLSGNGHDYIDPSYGLIRDEVLGTVNSTGQAIGWSERSNALGHDLGQDAWFYNGSSTQLIGLTGAGYDSTVTTGPNAGTYRTAYALQLNAAGQVMGYTTRRRGRSPPDDLGQDAWLFTGATTQVIGLTGTGYQYTSGSAMYRYGVAQQLNDAGQVAGYSFRRNASGGDLGQDAWFYTGLSTQVIGLTGSEYEYAYTGTGGGTYRWSQGVLLNAVGQVVGSSARYNAAGDDLGGDAWVYNGTSTQLVGLTGNGYEVSNYDGNGGTYRSSFAYGLSATGQTTGQSYRFNTSGGDLGRDAWVYNGTSTQQIGLTGSGYEYVYTGPGGGMYRLSAAWDLNAAGQAAGYSYRYGDPDVSLGQDAWLFDGSATHLIGLTGGNYDRTTNLGTYRYNQIDQLSASGQVIGHSGSGDAWIYNGSTTKLIGLIGNGYEAPTSGAPIRGSTPLQLNDAGQVIGVSGRLNASNQGLGSDAWFYNGTSTQLIGLTGSGYEYPGHVTGGGIYRDGHALKMNDVGDVIGYTTRYDASGDYLGQSGWFFDDDTNTTIPLEFSFASNNESETFPAIITDTGVVVGSYELYNGADYLGRHAFWWSEDSGFYDLGTLVDGGLSAAGWLNLTAIEETYFVTAGDSPEYIMGNGRMINQAEVGHSAYLLSAVPEPEILAVLAMGGIALLRRRYSERPAFGS